MQTDRGENNTRNLFGVHEIPTDTCIRMLSDPVAPEYCFPVYEHVHQMLAKFDKRYAVLRKAVGRRQTFFDDLWTLARYWCFDGWDDMMRFMLRGLKIPDPGG